MVQQAAVKYVKMQLDAGAKPAAIRASMKKAGWKEADIEAAMAEASGVAVPVTETPAMTIKAKLPGKRAIDNDIFSAAFSIGRLLPAESAEDITATLAELGRIAEKEDFEKFSGLIEGLRLTVEGQDYETAKYEVSRVGVKIKQIFEEELNEKNG